MEVSDRLCECDLLNVVDRSRVADCEGETVNDNDSDLVLDWETVLVSVFDAR